MAKKDSLTHVRRKYDKFVKHYFWENLQKKDLQHLTN